MVYLLTMVISIAMLLVYHRLSHCHNFHYSHFHSTSTTKNYPRYPRRRTPWRTWNIGPCATLKIWRWHQPKRTRAFLLETNWTYRYTFLYIYIYIYMAQAWQPPPPPEMVMVMCVGAYICMSTGLYVCMSPRYLLWGGVWWWGVCIHDKYVIYIYVYIYIYIHTYIYTYIYIYILQIYM